MARVGEKSLLESWQSNSLRRVSSIPGADHGKGDGSNGTTYGNNTRVTVLGARKNGLWKVYAQYQNGDGNVTGVDCIYEEPSSVAYVD